MSLRFSKFSPELGTGGVEESVYGTESTEGRSPFDGGLGVSSKYSYSPKIGGPRGLMSPRSPFCKGGYWGILRRGDPLGRPLNVIPIIIGISRITYHRHCPVANRGL